MSRRGCSLMAVSEANCTGVIPTAATSSRNMATEICCRRRTRWPTRAYRRLIGIVSFQVTRREHNRNYDVFEPHTQTCISFMKYMEIILHVSPNSETRVRASYRLNVLFANFYEKGHNCRHESASRTPQWPSH